MTVVASVASRIFAIAPSLVLLGAAGCASLPPPADVSAPIERTVPALPATPTSPPPGRGLVILDSVSGPARATRIVAPPPSTVPAGVARRASGAEDQGSTLLCSTTPCAAYLPYGAREVLLESNVDVQRSAAYLVDVTDRPVVLRASLDANRPAGRGRFARRRAPGVGSRLHGLRGDGGEPRRRTIRSGPRRGRLDCARCGRGGRSPRRHSLVEQRPRAPGRSRDSVEPRARRPPR